MDPVKIPETDISKSVQIFNPVALRKAKIVCNFGVSECNRFSECNQMDPMKIPETDINESVQTFNPVAHRTAKTVPYLFRYKTGFTPC